ncbi:MULTISPECIES: DUF4232 domain-containing protein [unclassified Nocardiopsis]|uniref:DUF4232 domain-containing protein n=1 Tax=unclassified Nocardiopsis TaxID=2649073 RepID=UPI00130112D5|nr:DUF4232 domain-containing protein [Nocardiopsis sp. TSRI0078]
MTWYGNDARAFGEPAAGRTRARGAAVAAAVALACGPMVTAAPASAAAQESMRDCTVSDFAIVENERRAAAGTAYIEFTMTRTGEGDTPAQEPCNLYRHASLSWVDAEGERVGAWAEREGGGGSFTVDPGGTALLTVAQPNPGNYDPRVCEPAPVTGIEVSLYIAEAPVHVPTGGGDTACANPEVAVPRYTVEPHQ